MDFIEFNAQPLRWFFRQTWFLALGLLCYLTAEVLLGSHADENTRPLGPSALLLGLVGYCGFLGYLLLRPAAVRSVRIGDGLIEVHRRGGVSRVDLEDVELARLTNENLIEEVHLTTSAGESRIHAAGFDPQTWRAMAQGIAESFGDSDSPETGQVHDRRRMLKIAFAAMLVVAVIPVITALAGVFEIAIYIMVVLSIAVFIPLHRAGAGWPAHLARGWVVLLVIFASVSNAVSQREWERADAKTPSSVELPADVDREQLEAGTDVLREFQRADQEGRPVDLEALRQRIREQSESGEPSDPQVGG